MTQQILKVKNNKPSETINEFLKELLKKDKLQALIVPQMVPSKKTVFPVLITDPEKLNSDVFAPVLPASTAKIVSKITKFQSSDKKIGVVIHPCQIRALVELVKLNQADMNNIIIIGIDCLGTFSLNMYTEFPDKKSPTEYIIDDYKSGKNESEKYLRTSCLVCNQCIPENADIIIGFFGMDISKEILVESTNDSGKKILEGIKLETFKNQKNRDKRIKEIIEQKNKKLQDFLKDKSSNKGIDFLSEFFDKCINCHNCMNVCPICYCKECLFDSSVFDAEAYKYLNRAKSHGAFKMPNDSVLFHLGRMNHMILSCVECGLCEQACPMNIPLMEIFIPCAENAQKEFKYSPGKSSDEKIPMIVYREDEYVEVGEK